MTIRTSLFRITLAGGLALAATACSKDNDKATTPKQPAPAQPAATPTGGQATPTPSHDTDTYGADNGMGTEDRTYTNTYDQSRGTGETGTTGAPGTINDDTSDGSSATGGSEHDTTANPNSTDTSQDKAGSTTKKKATEPKPTIDPEEGDPGRANDKRNGGGTTFSP